MTPEEFRRAGHDLVDWIADFRATLENRPVMARTTPGEVARAFPKTPPDAPQPIDEIFTTLDATIVPGLTHFGHPRFFGFFPTGASLSSVLGDFASTGLGALGLTWQSAPALTELEEVTTDWVRQMVGLSPAWRGVIQDTASTATLVALVCARERASNFALTGEGLQGGGSPLVVYVSGQSHSSVLKAALVAGFGRAYVREVATDASHAMRAEALDRAMREDHAAAGRRAPSSPRRAPRPAPPSIRSTRSRPCAPSTAPGCTSTRRWPDRRWSSRRAGRCGPASSAPTRSC